MNARNLFIYCLISLFSITVQGATLRTFMYDPTTSNTTPTTLNIRAKSLDLSSSESGIAVFTATTSGKKLAFTVPDTLAAGTTNEFSFSSPSAGQAIGIHSYSNGRLVWTNITISAGSGTNNPVILEGPQNTIINNQISRSQWSTNQSFAFSLAVGASNQSSITYTKLENLSTNTIYASNSFSVFSKRDGSNVSVFPILPNSSLDLYSYLDASNVWNVITYGAEFEMIPDGTSLVASTNYTTGKITWTAVGGTGLTNFTSIIVTNVIKYNIADIVVTNTDPTILDLGVYSGFRVKLLTNGTLVVTNQYDGFNRALVNVQQGTNGMRELNWSLNGGILQTNADKNYNGTTNANGLTKFELRFSTFSTNLELAILETNLQPRIAFTNSLASGTVTLPLELVTTPATAAYSVSRKLTNSYSGALALVVRSSDGATNYLTGTSTGNNISTILSWAGTDTVYVTNLFDQTGNGRHSVQGDTNLCFVIATNGVAVNKSGITAMQRIGDNATSIAASVALNEPVSYIGVVYAVSITSSDIYFRGGSTTRHALKQLSSTYRLNNTANVDIGTLTANQWDIVQYKFLNTATDPDAIAVDGGTFSTGEAGSSATTSLGIGDASVCANMLVSTWIVWAADVDAGELGDVRDNINAFMSVY